MTHGNSSGKCHAILSGCTHLSKEKKGDANSRLCTSPPRRAPELAVGQIGIKNSHHLGKVSSPAGKYKYRSLMAESLHTRRAC